MKTRFVLLFALCCGLVQVQAQQPTPTPSEASVKRVTCPADRQAQSGDACMAQADVRLAMADPDKLLATEPTAAGPRPLARRQVVAEIERARRAGEMDFAAVEASLDSPRPR